jgi:hypothetical protein
MYLQYIFIYANSREVSHFTNKDYGLEMTQRQLLLRSALSHNAIFNWDSATDPTV